MPGAALSAGAVSGFYGKVPARGDFVRAGLPRRFTDTWDAWLQAMLAAGRARLGEGFGPAWQAAPVWRFALAPGICGPDAALGLWMPSIDRAGRHFPLSFARLGAPAAIAAGGAAFLDAAEQAGVAAIAEALSPAALADRLAAAPAPGGDDPRPPAQGTRWWTGGCPGHLSLPGLPTSEVFIAMLDEAAS